MPDLLPVTAASRSVALRFEPDSDLLAGSFLRLVTSPDASATARTIEGTELEQRCSWLLRPYCSCLGNFAVAR